MSVIVDLNKTLIRDGQPVVKTIKYINSLSEPVYIVSGSHESKRFQIERMLLDYGVKYTKLYLNPRKYDDDDFKYAVGKSLRPIGMAIDNSKKARARYESLGIPTMHPDNLPDIDKFWIL
jgi:hypothetical protein